MRSAKISNFLIGFVISLWLGAPVGADDTEIFFARDTATSEESAVNVLLMIDSSGSMGWYDDSDSTRIARMKEAVYELLDSAGDINMGVGAFNGFSKGGNILYPVRPLSEDLCPGYSCDSFSVHARVQQSADDATEAQDGTVSLANKTLYLVEGAARDIAAGIRFPALNIPRGATITEAKLVFQSFGRTRGRTNLDVSAHDIGNSQAFQSVRGNLTSREKTTASVNWRFPSSSSASIPISSPDISNVVQEIVNRSDWCGGNATSMIIEGRGSIPTYAFDEDKHLAPALKVTYDPSSVDMANTCIAQRQSMKIAYSADDAVELVATGQVDGALPFINLASDGSGQTIGLRFRDVQLPANAVIIDAWVEFTSAEDSDDAVLLEVSADAASNSTSFNAGNPLDLSSRVKSNSRVLWNISGSNVSNSILKSPDISPVIQGVVNNTGWSSNNTLSLLLTQSGGTGTRNVYSFDGDESNGANLVISYQIDSPSLNGMDVKVHTVRDELRQRVGEITAQGGTPLMDMYYEAAAFMRGDAMEYGKRRGAQKRNDRYKRLSHPDSFSGGILDRDPRCTDSDLDSLDCIDEEIQGNPIYNTPIVSSCQANQIVLISDGAATDQSSKDLIQDMTGVSSCVATGTSAQNQEWCGYELAEWLYESDQSPLPGMQNIVTHTIGFNFSSSFLANLASRGGGGFYEAGSSKELSSVFRNIIKSVADVTSSFVAPGATVSQFNRLANRDDVYYAMFKPSLTARWDGNLKRYELGESSGSEGVSVLDREGNEVFDSVSGLTVSSSKSFWHTGTDGGDVAQGGAASRLDTTRDVKTALPNGAGILRLVDLHESVPEIDRAMLGIESETGAYRTRLLQWIRGVDINDHDFDGNTSETREQMGDPMHSQPTILNYESTLPQGDSVIFMGTNEGFLHAINSADGEELFAYMPPSLLGNIDTLYTNSNATNKPYGVDGNPVAWIVDKDADNKVDSDEQAFVVFGMRRGGAQYQALNVTEPTDPSIAWSITGGVGSYEELGQSWSTPVKTLMRIGGEVKDVLVFGGGYDPDNDSRETREATDSIGRAIFIVDALTGALIESITRIDFPDMLYSIPSKVSVIDINSDGMADRFYVGDMGGQLWRFDIGQGVESGDSLSINGGVIADLGGENEGDNRRFYYEPDVSLNYVNGNQFLGIAIGSGWRAHPLDTVVDDRFFMVKDYAVFGAPRNADNDIAYTKQTNDSLFDATSESADLDTSDKSGNGWYIDLVESGEKVLSSAVTINNQVIFTTYLPDANVDECSASVGGGRAYVVDSFTGLPALRLNKSDSMDDRYKTIAIPGIPPSASILFPESDGGEPSLFTGMLRIVDDFDVGPLLKRTHWYEATEVD